ncbi:MAG: class I SAM-dependent methyltransferase [Pseudomonadales bacterium]|nr:class I SAM-dependent methyltransferase [Pseudomonadales bacterium]
MQLPPLNRISFRASSADLGRGFNQWLDGEPGQALLAAEREMLTDWLRRQVGQRAVAIYAGDGRDLLAESPLRWQTSIAPEGFRGVRLQSRMDLLPLAKSSVDLLMLHHVMDFSRDPHQVLREASRCISHGGMIAIIGFHPVSLMGLGRWLLWRKRPAWSGRFYRPNRLTDWLQVLGFEVDGMASGFYTMPLSDRARGRLRLLEWLGSLLWPRHGNAYLLVARKRAGVVRPLPSRQRQVPPNAVVPVPVARWGQQNRES